MAPIALIELLNRNAAEGRRDIAVAVLISGAANTAILAVINQASRSASYEELNGRLLVIFLVALALYVLALRYSFDAATRTLEEVLTRIRVRLMERIAGSELLILQEIGKPRIFQAVTQDTALISESQGLLVAAAQSVVMVACTAVYVLSVSAPAFLTIAVVIGLGVLLYLGRSREMARLGGASTAEEVRFLGMTGDLVDGLKEVKLSHARREAVLDEMTGVALRLRTLKIRSTGLYNASAVFSQCFFYVLIAVIVFVLPRLVPGFAPAVPELVATVLFIIGPLSTVVTAIPAFTKADRAARSLMALEGEIDRVAGPSVSDAAPVRPAFADAIRCAGLAFRYPGEDSFGIGPLDLVIPKGEITMIIGGNGSGKTTFLKVLAGLYIATSGTLNLDGRPLPSESLPGYRELFGAIFSDFHLFRKLYGVPATTEAVTAELGRMAIANKVGYGPDGFGTTDLSTGQRKRVAMAVAMLEDRPVLIFDEWAADQDPDFRRFFYETLLPELKARGKTLLVATHDDRFFDKADTIVKMELGRIQSIQRRDLR